MPMTRTRNAHADTVAGGGNPPGGGTGAATGRHGSSGDVVGGTLSYHEFLLLSRIWSALQLVRHIFPALGSAWGCGGFSCQLSGPAPDRVD